MSSRRRSPRRSPPEVTIATLRRRIARATREVEELMAPYARHNRHKQELRDARDRAEKYLGYRRKLAAIDREERDAHHAITSQRTAYRSLGFVQHQRADPKTDVRPYLTPAARADHDAISARAQRARADLEEALARVAREYLEDHLPPTLPEAPPSPTEAGARLHQLEQALEERLRRDGPKIARAERLKAAAAAHDGATRTLAGSVRAQLRVTRECPYCGGALGAEPHADHIYPVALGGQSRLDNMVLVCAECNRRKRDRTLRAFIEEARLDRTRVEARLARLGKTF